MKSTIRSTSQLAKILGISRWTVSRALNGYPGISKKTVDLIHKTAREHGFSPSLLGRGLRSGKTNLIGICLPDLEDYFLTNKLSRLQEGIEARGYSPIIQMTKESENGENHALGIFSAMHCAGIVAIASRLKASDPSLRALISSEIPVIMIDPMYSGHKNVIASDRAYAMKLAVDYFISQGHRKIAILGVNPSTGYGQQRVDGLKAACSGKKKMDFNRDILFLNLANSSNDFETGEILAKEYLKLSDRPKAILALNDRIAMGAMRTLQSSGLKISQDVSIMGYDNAEFAPFATPALTTLDPKVSELIDKAIDLLLSDKILSVTKPILVTPTLVQRASTGPAR